MMQWLSFISVLLIPIRGAKQWSILWGWPHAPILTFGDSITEWMANFDIAYAQRSWRKSVKLFWEIHGRPACLKSFQAKIKTDTCEISPLWFLFGNTRRFWWASFLLPVFSDPPVGNKENMRSSVPDRLETKSFIFLSKKCTKALGPETVGMVVFGWVHWFKFLWLHGLDPPWWGFEEPGMSNIPTATRLSTSYVLWLYMSFSEHTHTSRNLYRRDLYIQNHI